MRIIKSFEICQKLNLSSQLFDKWHRRHEDRWTLEWQAGVANYVIPLPFSLQHIEAINNVTIWTCVWYSVGFFDRHFWPTGCGHTLDGRSQLMRKFEVSVGGVILYTHLGIAAPRRRNCLEKDNIAERCARARLSCGNLVRVDTNKSPFTWWIIAGAFPALTGRLIYASFIL